VPPCTGSIPLQKKWVMSCHSTSPPTLPFIALEMQNLSKLCSGGRRDAVHHPRCCRCRCSTGCHTLWRTNNPAIQCTALTLHVSWSRRSHHT
jgi:hypothetical protein